MTIKFASQAAKTDASSSGVADVMNKLIASIGGTSTLKAFSAYEISGTISLFGNTYNVKRFNGTGTKSSDIISVAYDESQQTAVFYNGNRTLNTNSTLRTSDNSTDKFYFLIITPTGVHAPNPSALSYYPSDSFNVGSGTPIAASSTIRANLTPLVVWGEDASPVFISSNLVMDTAGTIVTDTAGTKFVSLGNLLYIRETTDANTKGTAVTCRVGNVTTLPAGSNATVSNVGTLNDVILDFGIPTGSQGPTGPQGDATKAYVDQAIADAIAKLKADNTSLK